MSLLEEYFPIVEGQVYSYRYESAEWPEKSTATMRVKNVISAGGKTTAVWEETNPDPPDPLRPFVIRWKVERSGKGVIEGDKDWMIKTPLRQGTSWERNDGTMFKIWSLKERIEVPAGVYENCLCVSYENDGIGTGALYYAKGVGLVRSIQRGEWVPYDYWLKSVTDGQAAPAVLAEKAIMTGGPRRMMRKGSGGTGAN